MISRNIYSYLPMYLYHTKAEEYVFIMHEALPVLNLNLYNQIIKINIVTNAYDVGIKQ